MSNRAFLSHHVPPPPTMESLQFQRWQFDTRFDRDLGGLFERHGRRFKAQARRGGRIAHQFAIIDEAHGMKGEA